MSFEVLCWLFTGAVTIHNIEEAAMMPRWQPPSSRLQQHTGKREFRFAVVVLTLAAYGVVGWALLGGRHSIGAYLVCGYALAMLINVFLPHLLIALRFRGYTPGVMSAVLLNLPVTYFLLRAAFREDWIEKSTFLWAGPLIVVALLASLPLLFKLGRMMFVRPVI